MSDHAEEIGWPSAAVAIAVIALITIVTVAAINRYEIDGALKFWSALGPVVGILTGAVVTYFFTSRTVAAAKSNAVEARKEAEKQGQVAKDNMVALLEAAVHLDKQVWLDLAKNNPAIARVVRP
jgi:hypothetical protein